jgi:hypothetical protein
VQDALSSVTCFIAALVNVSSFLLSVIQYITCRAPAVTQRRYRQSIDMPWNPFGLIGRSSERSADRRAQPAERPDCRRRRTLFTRAIYRRTVCNCLRGMVTVASASLFCQHCPSRGQSVSRALSDECCRRRLFRERGTMSRVHHRRHASVMLHVRADALSQQDSRWNLAGVNAVDIKATSSSGVDPTLTPPSAIMLGRTLLSLASLLSAAVAQSQEVAYTDPNGCEYRFSLC